jgi:F0F1-type ATP synthase delta subunit
MNQAKELIFTMDDEQEQEQPPQQFTGLSRDDHISQFLTLDAQIKELSYRRREHASALTEAAFAEKNGQQRVRLRANDGSEVIVEFQKTWVCDSAELETAKELLKDEMFSSLFKTEYTPKVRALRTFLNTVFSDERSETAKQIIKEFCKETDKHPYVSSGKK